MSEGLIFWHRRLRVAGPRAPREALERLQNVLSGRASGFAVMGQRLVGSIRGTPADPHIALWRRSPLSAAGDVIEFRGTVKSDGEGSAFEGELAYSFGTKLQFVGLLVVGALLLLAGAVRQLEGTASDRGMLLLGVLVAGVAAVWIYSSSRTRGDQIRFIERHLESCVARDEP